MAEWSLNLDKWASVQEEKIAAARRVFAFELFSKIVMRTPVDSGAARQNWLVTLNSENHSFDEGKTGKSNAVLSEGGNVIDLAKGDDTIIMQNNLPYIRKLEYGGYPNPPKGGGKTASGKEKSVNGFSRQSPNGMVGVTMAEANQVFEKAVKAIEGRKT
jgi:hypothetical protein